MSSRFCRSCGPISPDPSPSSYSRRMRAIRAPLSYTRARFSTPLCVKSARARVGPCARRRRRSLRGVPRRISPQLSPQVSSRRTGTLRFGVLTRRSRARGLRTSTRRKPARSSSRFVGPLGFVERGGAVSLCRATPWPLSVPCVRGGLRGLVCGASAGRSLPSPLRTVSPLSIGGLRQTATWPTSRPAVPRHRVLASPPRALSQPFAGHRAVPRAIRHGGKSRELTATATDRLIEGRWRLFGRRC